MSDSLRAQIVKVLDWEEAHVGYDAAVEGLGPRLRGVRPIGFAHSAWELVEHLRLAQHDILSFCVDREYHEKKWPESYWPADVAPPDPKAWDESIAAFGRDRDALKKLACEADLFAIVPHGKTQTFLRELLLVADHTTYHVAQLVDVRRALGAWK